MYPEGFLFGSDRRSVGAPLTGTLVVTGSSVAYLLPGRDGWSSYLGTGAKPTTSSPASAIKEGNLSR